MPITIGDKLYNCGVVIFKGDILGIVPKMFLPNYKEFYEQRWFTSGNEISNQINKVRFLNKEIPFGKLVFEVKDLDFKFALEICEDL
jgi:NAD+ synthase (glutamine-hydrolysing)